jgi:DEAD/DEAH box helicase domain-containing protein
MGPADGSGDAAAAPAEAFDPELYRPTLFLYDALPGGVGLARRIFERAGELMQRAASLVRSCPCPGGCPACIGPGLNVDEAASAERKYLAASLLGGLSPAVGA